MSITSMFYFLLFPLFRIPQVCFGTLRIVNEVLAWDKKLIVIQVLHLPREIQAMLRKIEAKTSPFGTWHTLRSTF